MHPLLDGRTVDKAWVGGGRNRSILRSLESQVLGPFLDLDNDGSGEKSASTVEKSSAQISLLVNLKTEADGFLVLLQAGQDLVDFLAAERPLESSEAQVTHCAWLRILFELCSEVV